MGHLVEGDIIPYYDEYLGAMGDSPLGFCLGGARFVCPDDVARADGTDMLQQVRGAERIIYIFM